MPATQTALVESRSWRVSCKLRLVIECELEEIVRASDDIGSACAAEAALRDRGWTIHADGTATCPTCHDVASGEIALTVRGSISAGHDGGLEAFVVPARERFVDGRWVHEEAVPDEHPVEAAVRGIAEIDTEEADDE